MLTSLPLASYAEGIGDIYESLSIGDDEARSETGSAEDVYEIIELRDKNVKQFKQEDGTIVAAQYNTPVHYLDENGDWQDIDNTLSESFGEYETSNARIKFAKKITGNKSMLTLHEGNHKIAMSLDGAKKKTEGTVTNTVTEFDTEATELQKMMTLDKLSSKILYADILDDVDIEYILNSDNIKENIIVKSEYTYTFTLKLNNLGAEIAADGDVHIFDPETKKVIYTIPNGYMYDANGEYSDSVYFSLKEKENGDLTFTVTADEEWLNDESRAFPVTIDPAVSVADPAAVDLYISQNYPNQSYSNNNALYVGNGYVSYWKMTSQVPVTLPDHAYIISASLTMCTGSSNDNIITAHQVTSGWDSALTWNKTSASTPQGAVSNKILDYNRTDKNVTGNGVMYTWDITSLVKSWYAGTANHGICFKTAQDTTTSTWFYSADETTFSACRPRFTLVYKDMKGIEPYWSYTSQEAGAAGTGYINNATGNLVFTKSMLSTTDSLMSYTPAFVYNSSLASTRYKYPNVQTSYWGSYMPMGFKLSMNETLIKKSYVNILGETKYYYAWTDSDATEHYFFPIGPSNTLYEDEDGLQLRLEVGADECTLTDDSKTVKTFIKLPSNAGDDVYEGWYLSEITDKNNNKISFTFDSGKRPITVSLTPNGSTKIDFLQIKYNESTFPYLIYNEASKEAIVLKYSSSPAGAIVTSGCAFLREVIYAHGNANTTYTDWQNYYESGTLNNITFDAKMSYLYDDDGYLIKVKDELSKYELRYTYSNGKVISVQEYANNTQLGQQIGFSYYTSYTEIRNSGSDDIYGNTDDIITVNTYDREGRTVSTYSANSEKTKVYGASSGKYEADEKIKNNIKSSASVNGITDNYLINSGFELGNLRYWTASEGVSAEEYNNVSGKYCAYFNVSTADTEYMYQYARLTPGDYTLSMAIRSLDCFTSEMYVKVQSINDPSHSFVQEVPLNEFFPSDSVTSFSMNFTAANFNSTGYETFKVYIEVIGNSSDSEVYVDDIMLEDHVGCTNYNFIEEGNFEKFSTDSLGNYLTTGTEFWKNDKGNAVRTTKDSTFGYVGCISVDSIKENYLHQNIFIGDYNDMYRFDRYLYEGSTKTTYIVSAAGKANGQLMSSTAFFGIRVVVNYYNGSGNDFITQEFPVEFQKDCNGWQFVCDNIVVDDSYYPPVSIDIYCDYSYQPKGSNALFDHVTLVESSDGSIVEYTYYGQDIVGDEIPENTALAGLVRTKRVGKYLEMYEYNDDRMITRLINNKGQLHDYVYKSNGVDIQTDTFYEYEGVYSHLSADSYDEIIKYPKTRTTYGYNGYGQTTLTMTVEMQNDENGLPVLKPDGEKVRQLKSYNTSDGSRIFGSLSSVREYGVYSNTYYYYDQNNGRLLAVLNYEEQNGTCYSYDALGNITAVMPAQYLSASEYTPVTDAEEVSYTYNERNLLSAITTGSTQYSFVYDSFGNTDSVSVGDRELAEYEYYPNNGKLKKITYGNGFSVRYVYDILENVKEIWYTDNGSEQKAYEYTYTAYGQLQRYDDLLTGRSIVYRYNTAGKLTDYSEYYRNEMANKFDYGVSYDEKGRVLQVLNSLDVYAPAAEGQYNLIYNTVYNADDSLKEYEIKTLNSGVGYVGAIEYTYDQFKRLSQKVYSSDSDSGNYTNTVDYSFAETVFGTSSYVSEYRSTVNGNTTTYTYTYDANGNITKILRGTQEFRYVYDDLGQLIREDNPDLNKTIVYLYDNAGNITTAMEYNLTAEGVTPTEVPLYIPQYLYQDSEWGDLLTTYNGSTITYDEIGNPTTYPLRSVGKYATLSWKNGRQLSTLSYSGTDISYKYNDNGVRVSKTVNGVEHVYHVSGTQIIAEKWNNNVVIYLYDADGSPIGMQYRSLSMSDPEQFYTYWFEKNLQGDVIAIYSDTGSKIVSYAYDAWGNQVKILHDTTGSNLYAAAYNYITYRGYYYDIETCLYYLNSRYYDPVTKRFINADGQLNSSLLGYNQFSYCENNPVNRIDPSGEDWWHWAIGATVVVGCAVATVLTCGGFAAAVGAVAAVGSGVAAATTASTVAAGAFIGSATAFASAVMIADINSNTADEFNNLGNWGTVATTVLGGFIGGSDAYISTKNFSTSSQANHSVSKGSTGRTQPVDLGEQLAMQQVKSNPSAGKLLAEIILYDPRWPSSDGWVKMQQIFHTSQGDIKIHYVYNLVLEIYDDFKFSS